MRSFPTLVLALFLIVSLGAISTVSAAQDSASDCVVSKNGICLDATLAKTGKLDVPPPAPKLVPVSLQGGRLTIISETSSLKDILTAVGSLSGIEMELPPAGLEERVVAHLGPGSTRDVLVELLNGSSFNYVMVASPANPSVLQKLVLTNRTGQVATAAVAPPPPPSNATEDNGPAVYGQGFHTDPNAVASEPEAPAPAAKDADWAHTQGQLLDQMQKQRIKEQQEQQQPQQPQQSQQPQGNPQSQ